MLLVRSVVFLIDDDQAKPWQRCEHRRAGPDHDARLAAVRRAPRIATFHVGKAGVHHRNAGAEAASKAIHQLRGQGDLWYENQSLAAAAMAAAMTRKYTSVLPLPVTP